MNYEKYDSLIMDISGSICYICDFETYELLHLTKAGMDAYGLTDPRQYQGKKCYEVLQGRTAPCKFCTNGKLCLGQEYRWEHYNDTINRWFDITDTLVEADGRLCRMEIARDITARKADSGEGMSMEDVLFRCLHVLATERDMNAAVNQFLSTVGSYYKAARTYIFEFDLKKQTTNNTFEWCGPGVSREIENLQDIPLEVVGDWIKKFEKGDAFAISSVDEERDPNSEEYRLLQMQGISSLLAAPLIRDKQIVGFIGVDDPERNGGNPGLLKSVSEFILAELERRRLMEELAHLSYTDILTGIFNRNGYRQILNRLNALPPKSMGVVAVSVNGLKYINETFGQKSGDDVLIRTADRLRSLSEGQVYRIGGDEFMIFRPEIDNEAFMAMIRAIQETFRQEQEYSVSMGYDWADGSPDIGSQLLRAEEWMRTQKQCYYHDEIARGRTVGNSADDLFREIGENRFVVWYQPQIDLQTGAVSGVEALVRKRGEDGNLIPPSQFIPFYEARNVLQHLDNHVLSMVLQDMKKLQEQGIFINASVNFSRSTLMCCDFAQQFSKHCAEAGVPASAITLEVTETIAGMGQEALRSLLKEIRQTGLKLSLDDFGTEYSNLSILTDVEFDEVKFDKSLVEDICTSGRSQIVLGRLMQMCRRLQQSRIVAEGIEEAGQVEILKSYGCDCGQGYYFHKPMPFETLRELLESRKSFATAEVCKTSDSFLTGQDYKLRYTLEEVLLQLINGGSDVYGYRIEGRRGLFSQRLASIRNIPEQVYDFPKWVVDHGQIDEASKGDWLALFSAIHRGDKHGSARVSFHVGEGQFHKFYLRFNSFADEEGNPFFATISFENVEREHERERQQSQDISGLLQATQKNFPEILTLNLTKGTYRMFSYHSGTTMGTPREGVIDEMINLRMNGVVEEDRENFYGTFCKEALEQTFLTEQKEVARLAYRRPGKDGEILWFETTAMRQTNEFNDDVLLIAMSRGIDAQKAEEIRLQEQLWLQTEELRVTTGRMRRTICFYDVAKKTLTVPEDYARTYHTEQVIENYPDVVFSRNHNMTAETQTKIRRFYEAIRQGQPEGSCEVLTQYPGMEPRWKRWEFATVYDRKGIPSRAVIFVEDVTEQHQHELAYRRMEESFKNDKAEQLLMLECDLTEDRIDKINGRMLPKEYHQENQTYSRFASQILEEKFFSEERQIAAQYFSTDSLKNRFLQGKRQLESQWRVAFRDGTVHWLDVRLTLMEDPYDSHVKAFIHITDITEEKNAQLEIQNRAERDGMTGLLNRATTQERILQMMAEERPGILLHIDLDDLKVINDIYGHGEGDRALRGIAETLRQHFRESDVIGRIGGDEFLVYLPGAAANPDTISASISQLLRKLTVIGVGRQENHRIHCSIGGAIQTGKIESFDELYKQADVALYHVKRSGKNNFAFYAPEMDREDYHFQSRHLMTLRNTKKLEGTELRYLPAAIADHYQLVMNMNLSTNDYFLMEEIRDGVFAELPAYGEMDSFVELVAGSIHPEDRSNFLNKLSREALIQAYGQGQTGEQCRFRFAEGEAFRWTEATAIFYTNENGDLCDFTLVRWLPETEM